MGCFSYLCPICGQGINSSSVDGENCILALLQDGICVEYMAGRYDSYGKIFKDGGTHELFVDSDYVLDEEDDDSILWEFKSWSDLVGDHFNSYNQTGFLAIHDRCWNGILHKTISYTDPDQGWNEIITAPDYKRFFENYK